MLEAHHITIEQQRQVTNKTTKKEKRKNDDDNGGKLYIFQILSCVKIITLYQLTWCSCEILIFFIIWWIWISQTSDCTTSFFVEYREWICTDIYYRHIIGMFNSVYCYNMFGMWIFVHPTKKLRISKLKIL